MTTDYFDDWYSFQAEQRMRTMTIVLGTGIPYSIVIGGQTPLNSTIIFDNGANFTEVNDKGSDFGYHATGILRLAITENVSINEWVKFTMDTGTKQPETVHLNIDLPDGVEGYLDLGTTSRTFSVLDGWYFRGSGRYSTTVESEAEPSVNFFLRNSEHVYASLRD